MEKLSEEKKQELADKQWEIAMEGNVPMLVWLGKQHLGQTDSYRTMKDLDSDWLNIKGL